MIEDIWAKLSADLALEGYIFRKIDPPSPDACSMKKCRDLCAQNLCGAFDITWGCPPGVGAEDECLDLVSGFPKAAVLMKRFENINFDDIGHVEKLGAKHQDVCRMFGCALREEGYRALPLSDGGCRYCEECSYPDEPCVFPDQKVASISAFGILMDEYMGSQNIDFAFEDGAMTLYGLILYDKPLPR
ncbi:MAG: DUF2284 domain-containing protein [Candidatus Methanoplasma sp.]|jgi:predicted metal-binding protein|nr:DUF2284 domain-containing protein [Candidatus Methanoplasma sp.]